MKIVALVVVLLLASYIGARPLSSDGYWRLSSVVSSDISATKQNFFGLKAEINEQTTICTASEQTYTCIIAGSAELQFAKVMMHHQDAIKLLRWRRKGLWLSKKNQPGFHGYSEQTMKIAGQNVVMQQGRYYRRGNIISPVLITAFDVVMNKQTIITVTTICDEQVWPAIKESVQKIERSLSL